MYPAVHKLVSYDTAKYNFAQIIAEDVFQVEDLSRLHETILQQKVDRGEEPVITYQDNMIERDILQCMEQKSRLSQVYHDFVWYAISPWFKGSMGYSGYPKFRVQMAGSPSVSKWHRDAEVTGRHDQITVWVPCVDTFDTNTLWVETEYGNQDYRPIPVKYGQALLLDSSYLWHGSVSNTTDVTRVSFDLRLNPKRLHRGAFPDYGILSARPPGYASKLTLPTFTME